MRMFRQSTNQNHYPVFGYWVTAGRFRRCWEEKTTRSNRMNFRLTLQAPNRYHWSSNLTRLILDFRSLSMHLLSTNSQSYCLNSMMSSWSILSGNISFLSSHQFLHLFLTIFFYLFYSFQQLWVVKRKRSTPSFFKFIMRD